MAAINLVTGVFLIGLGFLVKKFPDLIAGYNTMSPDRKEKVDIEGLSTMMRNRFVVMGILLAISDPVLSLIGQKQHAILVIISIVLFGTLSMVIGAQKFNGKGQNPGRKSTSQIVIISIVFATIAFISFGFLYYGSKGPEFKIVEKQLTISGLYGMTAAIESIELIPSLPKVNMKTNGFSYGPVRKGNFNLDEFGPCTLFAQSKKGPFIFIKTGNEPPIIINTASAKETNELLKRLMDEFGE